MKNKWLIAIGVAIAAFVATIYLGIFHGAAADVAKAALLKDPAVIARCGTDIELEPSYSGRSFVYPGEAAIYNGSPWGISRRAPLIGEHNAEIFCDELGLSREELSALAENGEI